MTSLLSKNKIGRAVGLSVFLLLTVYSLAGAATPRLFLTWKANNFYPSDFQGKALPTTGSVITASAAVLYDNALVNPRDVLFTWYFDDTWITQETGRREVTVSASKLFGDAHFVRAVALLPTGERIDASVRVPVTSPDLVIETSRGDRDTTLRAVPFFFNVSSLANLVFSWEADGGKQSSQNNILSLPSGLSSVVSVFVRNAANSLEFTKATITLP